MMILRLDLIQYFFFNRLSPVYFQRLSCSCNSGVEDIDDALIEGLEQNQDFFSLLLSNDEIKKQVLGIFTEEIYKSLREAN